jgi:glutaminyl-tRNA synthetase
LIIAENAVVEPKLMSSNPGDLFQFERLGYFVVDRVDAQPGKPIFNRIVTLRDSWAKIEQAEMAEINR